MGVLIYVKTYRIDNVQEKKRAREWVNVWMKNDKSIGAVDICMI